MTSWILDLEKNSRKEGRLTKDYGQTTDGQPTDRLSPGGVWFAFPKRATIAQDL